MPDKETAVIREADLVVPSLMAAAQKPTGEIATFQLISELTQMFKPHGKDAKIIPGRKDSYFSQKVRNLVCHREGETNFIANGYAEYTGDGIRITDRDRAFVGLV